MSFNLELIPFSAPGSYLAISHQQEGDLLLRTVRSSAQISAICKMVPMVNGMEAEYSYCFTPSELCISVDGGEVNITFAADDTLLIRGSQNTGLRLEFPSKATYEYICPICYKGKTLYIANCLQNNLRLLVSVKHGKEVLTQNWCGSSIDKCYIEFSGDDGFELSLRELATGFDGLLPEYDYDASKNQMTEKFNDFLRKMPTVPERYENAALTAAYICWSAIVKKSGFLTRDAMYMSKNHMCSVWSWDHCFNAMMLAYDEPEMAWDQFMLLFDYQDETGCIPDFVSDSRISWCFVKPPIHGWALSRMMKVMTLSDAQIKEAYEKLSKWSKWWQIYRDGDGDGIMEYLHGNDSGWDNSTVFSLLPPVEAPDLQAFLILQAQTLSELAKRLNLTEETKYWESTAENIFSSMLEHCFCNDSPVALTSGSHKKIDSQSLLLYIPIVLGKQLPENIRKSLIDGLSTGGFFTGNGFATEHPQSPFYVPDGYWRGPIWAPSTMLIIDGLSKCGETELAKQTAEAFADMIAKSGCAENFDALSGEGLRDRAYTWTASCFFLIANEYLYLPEAENDKNQ